MGSGRHDSSTWSNYAESRNYATSTPDQIFTQRSVSPNLNPHGVVRRESRDSVDNPASTPLIVALDVTGSMDSVLAAMAKQGLDRLMTEVYGRRPITDPHVMVMGIGDVEAGDRGPLQVTQFEADIRIAQQLEQVWLERGGGGNNYESYALAWYFAAYHTDTDAFNLRGQKGYLFTVGDEEPTPYLRLADIERVMGRGHVGAVPSSNGRIDTRELLQAVSEKWEVFHLIVGEGSHARAHEDRVRARWADLLGQRAIWLSQHTRMAEVIVSTLQLANGHSYDEVAASWDAPTAAAVATSLARGITFGEIRA